MLMSIIFLITSLLLACCVLVSLYKIVRIIRYFRISCIEGDIIKDQPWIYVSLKSIKEISRKNSDSKNGKGIKTSFGKIVRRYLFEDKDCDNYKNDMPKYQSFTSDILDVKSKFLDCNYSIFELEQAKAFYIRFQGNLNSDMNRTTATATLGLSIVAILMEQVFPNESEKMPLLIPILLLLLTLCFTSQYLSGMAVKMGNMRLENIILGIELAEKSLRKEQNAKLDENDESEKNDSTLSKKLVGEEKKMGRTFIQSRKKRKSTQT